MPNFYGEDGEPIDSTFHTERIREKIVVIIHSAGGKVNRGYNAGMERFLSILSSNQIEIDKIELDSSVAKKTVTADERRLPLTYPLKPWEWAPEDLRKEIGRTGKSIAQQKGAKGGNIQRRMKFNILDFQPGKSLEKINTFLSGIKLADEHIDEIRPLPKGLKSEGETTFTRSNHPAGWIYIITSPKWLGWVKIGITRNLSSRLSSYNTGVPLADDYFDYQYHRFHDLARDIEKKIHFDLKFDRRKGDSSEWYNMSIDQAREIISAYCGGLLND